jgi:Domain of unknown function (DUF5134)
VPHPTWLAYGFAVVMVTVSVYCLGRLAVARRWGRRNHNDVNVSHVLMGWGMVGMLVPRWNVVPNGLWELVFGVIVVWFLALSVRFVRLRGIEGTDEDHVHHLSHYLIHMVMACAMLYMYWLGMPISVPSGASDSMMSGPPSGAGDPALTLFLIAILIASAVWQLDSITEFSPRQLALSVVGSGTVGGGAGEPGSPGQRPWLAPRLEVACHIAMCVTMGYMLVLMV